MQRRVLEPRIPAGKRGVHVRAKGGEARAQAVGQRQEGDAREAVRRLLAVRADARAGRVHLWQ
eukprot:6138256-Prymnesium_polylepis.1